MFSLYNIILFTLDLESLYTNINIKKGIILVYKFLIEIAHIPTHKEKIITCAYPLDI